MFENIKENDVYRFNPNEEYRKNHFEWRHCFEGLFHVTKDKNGDFVLNDTFWSHVKDTEWKHDWESDKKWKIEEAVKNGEFKFVCNMNDIVPISYHNIKYYNQKDLFRLTNQHGCAPSCVHFFRNKDSKRDIDVIIEKIEEKISDAEYSLKSAENNIIRYKEMLDKVKSGELDIDKIYI